MLLNYIPDCNKQFKSRFFEIEMKYLAMYNVKALAFDTGNNVSFTAREYWPFEASDNSVALKKANEHGEFIRNREVDGKVTLKQLLKVEEVVFEKGGRDKCQTDLAILSGIKY